MLAIILCESNGDNLAEGSAGERGAMQLKQIALTDFNNAFSKNYYLTDLQNIYYGVEAGMGYFTLMLQRTNDRAQAIRAYHSGVGNCEDAAAYYYEKKVEAAEVLMKGKV
jgi:soluble lytic murein transglycosylase-like protein